MLPGFDGGPKMAKSIPGAGVSLADDPDGIRERIRVSGASAGAVDTDESAADAVFQAMCLASRYDAARLDGIEAARAAGTEAWTAAVADYAEFVADLAERWQATA
jgi:tryptophanyl-tRNA synthetase